MDPNTAPSIDRMWQVIIGLLGVVGTIGAAYFGLAHRALQKRIDDDFRALTKRIDDHDLEDGVRFAAIEREFEDKIGKMLDRIEKAADTVAKQRELDETRRIESLTKVYASLDGMRRDDREWREKLSDKLGTFATRVEVLDAVERSDRAATRVPHRTA